MDHRFKKFILRKLIKNARFNASTLQLDISQIVLSNPIELREVYMEGILYKYSKEQVDQYIQEICTESFNVQSKHEVLCKIAPSKIKIEQHLRLTHYNQYRQNTEELLKVGKNSYLLIDHDRGALKPGCLLETLSSPWATGSKVQFKVIDKNETENPISKIYETGAINTIELIKAPMIFELMDQPDKASTNRNIYAGGPDLPDGFSFESLSITASADTFFIIEQSGNEGQLALNISPETDIQKIIQQQHQILPPACLAINKANQHTKKMVTIEKGIVTRRENYWQIVRKAKIKFSKTP